MRRTALALVFATLGAAPLAAQDTDASGSLPAGWEARLDRPNASLADAKVVPMGDGMHFTLGPSGIFYRPADEVSGSYTVTATFTQTKAPQHPEAYGLFIGGRDLQGPQQDYLYFIIRGDGRYMVRHRAGSETHTIADWTPHAAVKAQDTAGKATNTLTIQVTDESVRLLANDQEVASYRRADVPYLNTDGIVGLRVNHNLDVHVAGFRIER